MGSYTEIDGDLIQLAIAGQFDVICQGVNCFCIQGAGLAPQMVKAFHTSLFPMEDSKYYGDINKLGSIDIGQYYSKRGEVSKIRYSNRGIEQSLITDGFHLTYIINAYTQYGFGNNHKEGSNIPLDYEALTLCLRKINHIFKGKRVGLPQIGAGLAGGSWDAIKKIIQQTLIDCEVTVVIYDSSYDEAM